MSSQDITTSHRIHVVWKIQCTLKYRDQSWNFWIRPRISREIRNIEVDIIVLHGDWLINCHIRLFSESFPRRRKLLNFLRIII